MKTFPNGLKNRSSVKRKAAYVQTTNPAAIAESPFWRRKGPDPKMTLMYHFYKTAPWFSFSSFWYSLSLVGASRLTCIINLWLSCASCDCTLSEKNCTTKHTSIMMLTIFNLQKVFSYPRYILIDHNTSNSVNVLLFQWRIQEI